MKVNKRKAMLCTFICMILIILGLFSITLTGCNSVTKALGGTMNIKLNPGEKLEDISWDNDDRLWYLTRPMRDNEEAETYTYQSKTSSGIMEGKVVIKEYKK